MASLFPIQPNSSPGPLTHLPEGSAVGSTTSTGKWQNVFEGAAKQKTTARRSSFDQTKAGTLNYFDMDTRYLDMTCDVFGNVQWWMHRRSDLLQSFNAILGDIRDGDC